MPHELIALEPRKPVLREYEEPELRLRQIRIRTEGIVTPVVPFEDSVEAYREIDEHPERSIKLGISFP